ncbi:unnamed protein product [Bemisia tabaci]|uniref:Ionotropic receptor n=1 Tax=Bemisia tabaci TaxID=7038 RepID=A0A9P0EZL8_BEMTA|nr:unnamed protein product [Bemisia tabaci]
MDSIRIGLIFLCVLSRATFDNIVIDRQSDDESFLIKVCENTLKLSKLRLSYIVNLSRDTCCTKLVQHLHSKAITTVLTNQVNFSPYMSNEVSKNIVIIVKDCSEVANLILGSMAGFGSSNLINTSGLTEKSSVRNESSDIESVREKSAFPNICILYDLKSGAILKEPQRPCDITVKITVGDLEDSCIISDELFELTGEAYNEVWNPDNYLIFVVSSGAEITTAVLSCNLFLIFRLVWRIFKGRRTVICSAVECLWYDSFFNKTYVFKGSQDEEYFDFEWNLMNKKALYFHKFESEELPNLLEMQTGYGDWNLPVQESINQLSDLKGGAITPIVKGTDQSPSLAEHRFVVKYDLSLLLIEANQRMRMKGYENYDHTFVTEFASLSFFVPRKGFKPQYLTVFKCFSLGVWASFLFTTATFLLVHYFHKWSQLRQLSHLYTEYELIQYESLSTAMTIYRHFLCVSQPRLLLGKLLSGKLLFGTFVVAAIVLTTLLQSGMVTFLNMRIRYSDVDTIRELAESDFLIQSMDIDMDKDFFGLHPEFDWVHERLVDNYRFSHKTMEVEAGFVENITIDYDTSDYTNLSCLYCDNIQKTPTLKVAGESVMRSVESAMTSDAFLGMASSQMMRKNIGVYDLRRVFEFHVLRERLESYPQMYFIPKHMFARDELNQLLSQMFEKGFVKKCVQEALFAFNFIQEELKEVVVHRRPFSMRDLRIAFICLGAGYLMSFIVFMLELSWNLYRSR